MAGYNKTIVVGRLGKDPEGRFTQNGKAVSNFSVAVDQGWGDNQRTEWYNVVAFGKTAEFANQYLTKGRWAVVEGEIRTEEYEKDGEKRRIVKLYASTIQPVGPKQESNGQSKSSSDDFEMPF